MQLTRVRCMGKYFLFFYVPYPFQDMGDYSSPQHFILCTLSNICIFTISPLPCSASHLQKFVRLLAVSICPAQLQYILRVLDSPNPLSSLYGPEISIMSDFKYVFFFFIFLFRHFVSQNVHRCFSDSKKGRLCKRSFSPPFSLKFLRYSYVPSMPQR